MVDKLEQIEHSLIKIYLKITLNIIMSASMVMVTILAYEAGAPAPVLALMISVVLLSASGVSDKKVVDYYNMSTNRMLVLIIAGPFVFAPYIAWLVYAHL